MPSGFLQMSWEHRVSKHSYIRNGRSQTKSHRCWQLEYLQEETRVEQDLQELAWGRQVLEMKLHQSFWESFFKVEDAKEIILLVGCFSGSCPKRFGLVINVPKLHLLFPRYPIPASERDFSLKATVSFQPCVLDNAPRFWLAGSRRQSYELFRTQPVVSLLTFHL